MSHPPYAYWHAKAYIAFIEVLESLPDAPEIPGVLSAAKAPNELRIDTDRTKNASEESICRSARELAQACHVGLRDFRTLPIEPLAGVPYNAMIGPLRMVMQYLIQFDTHVASLVLYGVKTSNGHSNRAA